MSIIEDVRTGKMALPGTPASISGIATIDLSKNPNPTAEDYAAIGLTPPPSVTRTDIGTIDFTQTLIPTYADYVRLGLTPMVLAEPNVALPAATTLVVAPVTTPSRIAPANITQAQMDGAKGKVSPMVDGAIAAGKGANQWQQFVVYEYKRHIGNDGKVNWYGLQEAMQRQIMSSDKGGKPLDGTPLIANVIVPAAPIVEDELAAPTVPTERTDIGTIDFTKNPNPTAADYAKLGLIPPAELSAVAPPVVTPPAVKPSTVTTVKPTGSTTLNVDIPKDRTATVKDGRLIIGDKGLSIVKMPIVPTATDSDITSLLSDASTTAIKTDADINNRIALAIDNNNKGKLTVNDAIWLQAFNINIPDDRKNLNYMGIKLQVQKITDRVLDGLSVSTTSVFNGQSSYPSVSNVTAALMDKARDDTTPLVDAAIAAGKDATQWQQFVVSQYKLHIGNDGKVNWYGLQESMQRQINASDNGVKPLDGTPLPVEDVEPTAPAAKGPVVVVPLTPAERSDIGTIDFTKTPFPTDAQYAALGMTRPIPSIRADIGTIDFKLTPTPTDAQYAALGLSRPIVAADATLSTTVPIAPSRVSLVTDVRLPAMKSILIIKAPIVTDNDILVLKKTNRDVATMSDKEVNDRIALAIDNNNNGRLTADDAIWLQAYNTNLPDDRKNMNYMGIKSQVQRNVDRSLQSLSNSKSSIISGQAVDVLTPNVTGDQMAKAKVDVMALVDDATAAGKNASAWQQLVLSEYKSHIGNDGKVNWYGIQQALLRVVEDGVSGISVPQGTPAPITAPTIEGEPDLTEGIDLSGVGEGIMGRGTPIGEPIEINTQKRETSWFAAPVGAEFFPDTVQIGKFEDFGGQKGKEGAYFR
jgi:hypothetical protein